ncbi:MAG TPA: DUF2207 domain-containing protein [Candidatus Acidoferrales bacterium]|nr:DUF2207 domain-containing protein [Candidatus Acidoferrales bacterium]
MAKRAASLRSSSANPLRRAVIAAALLFLFGFGSALSISTKELRIQKFEAEIVVAPSGAIDVTETIQARFIGGPWHGLYRTIPVEYHTPQGLNYTLLLNVKSITDGNGHKLKFESSRLRQYRKLKIYVPDADNSTQTIVIEYAVEDGLKFFEDHDELYWNVTGDEWDVPIEAASAHIVLPEGTTNIRTNVFTGAYRSTAREADAQVVGNGVDVQTRGPLGFHQGLTVAVAFDKGFVHEPTASERLLLAIRSNLPLLIPIAAFFIMFYVWWKLGRDPRLRPIAAQYEPPNHLTPGEVGTLVDNSADMRDITATIVDLAVRGFLVIEEKRKDHMLGLWHDKDYVFHSKKTRAEWTTLKPHEQELLSGMFFLEGDSVSLSDLHNRFYRTIPSIKSEIFASLIADGYYKRRPDSVRSTYIGIGLVVGFIIVWGGNAVASNLGMAPLSFIIAGILTGIIICAFGWFMPAHTQEGARALEATLGFEDFLSHVEADRFNRMIKTPEMFEKFLPFAMALGVEKNWSKAFQGIYTQPPSWYQGGYGPNFYPTMFVNDLNVMSTSAGSVMASAPRSSGGSGFGGGGGFSGGGFGGGGGGGF